MISVTEKALKKAEELTLKNNEKYLRVAVKGGGCSGFQYGFEFSTANEDDEVFDDKIVIDPISSLYLNGAIIDYKSSLEGDFFTIENPAATTTCGCGKSFGV